MRTGRWAELALAAVLVLGGAAAGCGSDDDDDGAARSGGSFPAAGAPASGGGIGGTSGGEGTSGSGESLGGTGAAAGTTAGEAGSATESLGGTGAAAGTAAGEAGSATESLGGTGAAAGTTAGEAGSATAPLPSTEYGCRPTRDGTRLKAKMLAGDDGSRFHQGWFDSELGVDCELAIAADGVRRCLPGALGEAMGPASKMLTFTDPQCTQRAALFYVSPCGHGAPASYAIWEEDDGPSDCVHYSHVYEVGERLDPFDTGYTLLEDGSCQPYDANEYRNWTFEEPYRVGEEVAPDRFVSVEGLEVVGERLQDVRIDLSDGSSQYAGSTYDSELDAECRAVENSDGTSSCIPLAVTGEVFGDSECSQPGVWDTTSACIFDKVNEVLAELGTFRGYAVSVEYNACGGAGDYHVYGQPEPESQALDQAFHLSASEPPECVATAITDGILRLAGPELPHETFATGERQTVSCGEGFIGGTRLRGRAMVWRDGWVERPTPFDTELGARCALRVAADGVERCLPGADVGSVYADPQCSRLAGGTSSCPEDATDFAQRTIRPEDPLGCESTTHTVHRLTGPVLAEAYYLDTDGVCTLFEDTDGVAFRELGEEVDPTTFVAIRDR